MKGFAKYFTLTILLILGLGCVGVLYLFFVPNSSLFGVQYVSLNAKTNQSYSTKDIHTIVISSLNYDVNISTTEGEDVSVEVFANSFGFVLTKNSTANIDFISANGTLTLNIQEPHGLATNNYSHVNVAIPENKEFNLYLKNKKAKTTINSDKLIINNLNYETENGDLNLSNAKIKNNIEINLNKATFNLSESIDTSKNNVKLKIGSGKFNATSSTFNNITITSNDRGVILFKECNQLVEDIKSAGGRIEADKVSNVNIKTSATNVYIKEITAGAIVELESGSVNIESLTGINSSIITKSGDIYIKTVKSNVILKSDDGNITVTDACSTINTETEYGNINVTFNEESANLQFLIAKVKDGYVYSKGVKKISLTITGNGRANVTMSDVIDESSINGNSGSVYVVVNKDSTYKLTTKSEGSVRVNLTQIPEYGGYTDKEKTTYVNCPENSNQLNALEVITTSGSLTVLDTNFA